MADILSPQGQWRWDEESQDWVPNATSGFQGGVQGGVSDVSSGATSGDNFKKAYLLDLMQTGGKNLSKIKAIEEAMGGAEEKEIKKQSAALRKEYRADPQTKSFIEVQKQWNNMQSAGQTGGGDISIMYSYIKMLDPTTAVREGELALGDRASGLPDRVVKAYNRAVKTKGAGLAPEQRKQFITEGGKIYNNMAREQQKLNSFYSGLATDSGADPDSVIGTLKDVQLAEIQEAEMEKKDKGLLYNLLVKPYETTAANVGALGQVGLSSLVGKFNPQAGAQLAQEGIFGEGVAERQRLASENPLQAVLDQGLASAEIAGQAKLLKGGSALLRTLRGGGGAGQQVVGAAEKVRSLSPKSIFGRRQAEAAAKTVEKGVEVSSQNLINAGKKLAATDPDIEVQLAKQIPKLKNIKDVPTLLDRMQVWGRGAYKAGGGIKATAKADLYDELYKTGLNELKAIAPEVYKNRQLLRLTFELPRQLGRGLWKATLGKILLGGL